MSCFLFSLPVQWMPESARYDVACGHPEKALATLERIAKENGKPMPLGKLVHANVQVRNGFYPSTLNHYAAGG